jgi:hypothetical protein
LIELFADFSESQRLFSSFEQHHQKLDEARRIALQLFQVFEDRILYVSWFPIAKD